MLLALAMGAALAQDDPSLDAVLLPGVVDRMLTLAQGRTFSIQRDRASGPLNCWDEAGAIDVDIAITLGEVRVEFRPDSLLVDVDLASLTAERMTLYARDAPDDGDQCEDLDAVLEHGQLIGGGLTVELRPHAVDGELVAEVVRKPELRGKLDMDITWAPDWASDWGWDLFPDDLVIELVQDDVMEAAADAIEANMPTLVDRLEEMLVLSTTVGRLDVAGDVAYLAQDGQGIELGLLTDLSWTPSYSCDVGERAAGEVSGEDPHVAVEPDQGSSFGLGVSERFANHLLAQLWQDGFFCLNAAAVEELVLEALPELADVSGRLYAGLSLEEAPVVMLYPDGVGVAARGISLVVQGTHEGRAETLLELQADAQALIAVRLDPDVSALVIDLDDLVLDMDVIEADHLLTGGAASRQEFEDFLERWLPRFLAARLAGTSVLGRAVPLGELRFWIDRIEPQTGGVGLSVSVYHQDDPEVDSLPPETITDIVEATDSSVGLRLSAVDDRSAPVSWRWRLDEGAWSGWSTETVVSVGVLGEGEHRLEVVARDAWGNEDPTPAVERFELRELQRELGGGCSVLGRLAGSAWLLGLGLGLLWRRQGPTGFSPTGTARTRSRR